MTSDSRTAGYLIPDATPAPVEDTTLAAAFQGFIVGITGLPGAMVRPRWQPFPPTQPDVSTNWVAVGVHGVDAPGFAWEGHFGTLGGGLGEDAVGQSEELEVLCSCYGPNAGDLARKIRYGAQIGQNTDALGVVGVRVKSIGDARAANIPINGQWYNRVDITVYATRAAVQVYPIRTVVEIDGIINSETVGPTSFQTAAP